MQRADWWQQCFLWHGGVVVERRGVFGARWMPNRFQRIARLALELAAFEQDHFDRKDDPGLASRHLSFFEGGNGIEPHWQLDVYPRARDSNRPEEKLRLVHLGSLLGAKQVRKPTLRALKAVMKCCPYFEITTDGRSRILVKEATYRAAKLAARKERATEKNTRKWLMRVAMLGNTIREERSQRKAYEKAGTHIAWWHPMHLALRNPLVFLTIREDTPRENDPLVTRVQHVRNEQKEAARRILVSIGEDPRIGAEYGV